MRYPRCLLWIAAGVGSLAVLAAGPGPSEPIPTDIPQPVDHLPPRMRPATDQELHEAVQLVEKNRRLPIQERLERIEQLSAELQRETRELRQDLRLPSPQTQPVAPPPEVERVPSVNFR